MASEPQKKILVIEDDEDTRTALDPNWFQIPFAALTAAVAAVQIGAFVKSVVGQRRRTSPA